MLACGLGSDIGHLGTRRATARRLTWVRAMHVIRAEVEYTFRLSLVYCQLASPSGFDSTEKSIPEGVDYREIGVCVQVMHEMKLLLVS